VRVFNGSPTNLKENDEETIIQRGVEFGALGLRQYRRRERKWQTDEHQNAACGMENKRTTRVTERHVRYHCY